jgi:dipeptidyl aminopeptidase/acylaminoacyl peptidase
MMLLQAAMASAVLAEEPMKLIPRDVLFGNPERAIVNTSPDGKQLAFLAPLNGVLNVWVCPAGELGSARAVTHSTKRPISQFQWAYTSKHILYLQDEAGDENFHLHVVDLAGEQDKDLTPIKGARAEIMNVSDKLPDEVLIGINDRNPMFSDVHRINIETGKDTLVLKNPEEIDKAKIAGFLADDDYNIRMAFGSTNDAGQAWFTPKADNGWQPAGTVGPEDALTTQPFSLDRAGKTLYLGDSRGRDTAGLFALDLATGKQTLLAEDGRCDLADAMISPIDKTVQAAQFDYDKRYWKVLDPKIQGDLDYLNTVADGEVRVLSRSQDDTIWTVAISSDHTPTRYYRYDRNAHKAEYLFSNRPKLEQFKLASMKPSVIKSRDGLDLVSYITLPMDSDPQNSGKPAHALPTVLFVHGGPWARDNFGYNPYHQWLANRGYAVISVNFRGSTGFGKKFVNAGNMEWGAKMHNDLLDVVDWAVAQGIADKDKVAIMGGSYGGYATLVGMTFTPDEFACGVDICGPCDLALLIKSIPPYWAPALAQFTTRVGDYRTEDGKKFLDSRSPITFVDKITKPLLIGQGANDPRVKQDEADLIVKHMNDRKIPVTYLLYSDEGHGFSRPPNNLSFNAVTECFLAEHLGGRCEAIGEDFKGSTIAVPSGADQIPGLADALKAHDSAGSTGSANAGGDGK